MNILYLYIYHISVIYYKYIIFLYIRYFYDMLQIYYISIVYYEYLHISILYIINKGDNK